jgi:hypothetical protein
MDQFCEEVPAVAEAIAAMIQEDMTSHKLPTQQSQTRLAAYRNATGSGLLTKSFNRAHIEEDAVHNTLKKYIIFEDEDPSYEQEEFNPLDEFGDWLGDDTEDEDAMGLEEVKVWVEMMWGSGFSIILFC